eukprot:TRINITY_DN2382_c0_g1_i1.p1 TRINITY_DN2382_c0_g1~~TRINITY_DN2382_c0_g1_i1.p1  ORF type:complete len:245 (-),score=37.14 TRINITY_DN2382_c0_g1_i1:103-837(-)
MHNEMSYTSKPPSKAFFCSLVPATERGCTPLADFRQALHKINPEVVEKLKKRGIKYTRLYIDESQKEKYKKLSCEIAKSWQDAFMTKDRKQAEASCLSSGFVKFQWAEDNSLFCETQTFKPTRFHPVTGEEVWFSQLPGWDPRMGLTTYLSNPVDYNDFSGGEALVNKLPYEQLFQIYPQGCLYADDGSVIELDVLKHIHDVTWGLRVEFEWQVGDIAMIDNYYTAHGRTQYKGDRLTLAYLLV